MLWTKFKYENKRRAKAERLSMQEFSILCTALPLNKIYPLMKFHNHSKYSVRDMLGTKFKYEKQQRAILKN